MTFTKDNPNDTFWLARYAHNTLAPVIEGLRTGEAKANLRLSLNFKNTYPGVDIWIHHKGTGTDGVLDYKLAVTKAGIDALAASLPAQWQALVGVPA